MEGLSPGQLEDAIRIARQKAEEKDEKTRARQERRRQRVEDNAEVAGVFRG